MLLAEPDRGVGPGAAGQRAGRRPPGRANGYLPRVHREDGQEYDLVANPVQMDEPPDQLRAAPGHGEHTDEILLDLGLDWDAIIAHKTSGAVL